MKSKAQIKSHPIHPILIPFPIAFFIGTFIFDLLGFFKDNTDLIRTAYYLEVLGIASALIAAVPGVIDYIFTVPPQSSAKKRATSHGLLNVTTVIFFSIALAVRKSSEVSFLVLGLEMAGVALLFIAGWMGGTLVHRNQIGVDIRYAHAGKWSEKDINQTSGLIEVAEANELKVNQMKLLRLKDKRVVLGRSEDGYGAFDDRCTHKGGSLAGGAMICNTVQCPWHGSQFSVKTGTVKAGPADQPITIFKIIEESGKVFLQL